MLSDDIVHISHPYRTNMEIYSLIVAWGLELKDTVDKVRRVLKELITKKNLDGLDSVLEWVFPRVGIVIFEGMVEPGNPIPFVR